MEQPNQTPNQEVEEKPTPQAQPPVAKGSKLKTIIVFVVIVLVAAYLAYAYTQQMWPLENLGSESTSISTEDWNTFTNTRYNYSIKYPGDWVIDSSQSEADFTPRGEEQILVGGDTAWSNLPLPQTPDETVEDLHAMFLFVFKVNPEITLDEFMGVSMLDPSQVAQITVGDLVGVQTTSAADDYVSGIAVRGTAFKVGDQVYLFTFSEPSNESLNEVSETMATIVSTFSLN